MYRCRAERVWALRNVGATLALGGPGEVARARQMLEKAALLKARWAGGQRHPGLAQNLSKPCCYPSSCTTLLPGPAPSAARAWRTWQPPLKNPPCSSCSNAVSVHSAQLSARPLYV